MIGLPSHSIREQSYFSSKLVRFAPKVHCAINTCEHSVLRPTRSDRDILAKSSGQNQGFTGAENGRGFIGARQLPACVGCDDVELSAYRICATSVTAQSRVQEDRPALLTCCSLGEAPQISRKTRSPQLRKGELLSSLALSLKRLQCRVLAESRTSMSAYRHALASALDRNAQSPIPKRSFSGHPPPFRLREIARNDCFRNSLFAIPDSENS
jgi:hypothetical protein